MENIPCTLPLDFVRRAPSLNHGHESSRWRECLLFDSQLPWLDMLDCGGLVALLYHARWRIRRWWWSIVSYRTGHWLLGLHPLLKCSTEAKEFPALDEEMSGSSDSIFIEVHVSCAPPHRASLPMTAVADHVVGATPFLASNRGQRFCYYCHSSCFRVAFRRDYRHGPRSRSLLLPYPWRRHHRSSSDDFLSGAVVKLIFCIDVTLR
jgi:hypothetical protein